MPTQSLLTALREITGDFNKTAAEATSEPPGNGAGSDTAHPVKNVDDSLHPVKDGFRTQEMNSDLESRHAANINQASAPTSESAEARATNVGLESTGSEKHKDETPKPAVEETQEGTSSDATFADGQKFGSDAFLKLSPAEQDAYLEKMANSILGTLIPQAPGAAAAKPAAPTAPAADANKVAQDLINQTQAGYETARALGLEKLSAEQRVQATVAQTIRDANYDAELLISALAKHAEDEASGGPPSGEPSGGEPEKKPEGGDSKPPGDKPSSPSGPAGMTETPSGKPDTSSGDGAPSEAAIMQALQLLLSTLSSGGGMPGGAPGGMPGAGGPPGAGAPPAPGGDPLGGIPGGPPSQDELMQGLAMGGMETGKGPDELAQAGGEVGQKLASAIRAFKASGKFEFSPVTTKRARAITNVAKGMLNELIPPTR